MQKANKQQSKWYYGGVASIAATCVTHPMDLIKVRLQIQSNRQFRFFGMVKVCFKQEGVRGFYAGLDASLMRQISLNVPRLGIYEIYKNKVNNGNELSLVNAIIASCIGGVTGGIMGNPSDVVNVRMQNDKRLPTELRRNYKHAFHGLVQIIKTEGVGALFKGMSMTSIRAVLVTLGQVGGYDQIKAQLVFREVFHNENLTYLTSGFGAGLTVCFLVNPFDVIKSRIMSAQPNQYKNLFCCVKKIASEGFLKFYVGVIPAFLRIGPHATILFMVKEMLIANSNKKKTATSDE